MKKTLLNFTFIFFIALISIAESQDQFKTSIQTTKFGEIFIHGNLKNPNYLGILLSTSDNSKDEQLIDSAISSNGLIAKIQLDKFGNSEDCLNIGGEFERLSQIIQKQIGLKKIIPPIIIGANNSAAIAELISYQAEKTFNKIILVNPIETINKSLKICDGDEHFIIKNNKIESFTKPISQALIIKTANTNYPKRIFSTELLKIENFSKELETFLSYNHLEEHNEIEDLPVFDLSEQNKDTKDKLILFLSGDGGWATIDKEIAENLIKKNYNLIGFDSLKYFWNKKTEEDVKRDFNKIIKYYDSKYKPKNIILIGFSFGADVAPFIYNLTSYQNKISKIILLSPALINDFEVELNDWISSKPEEKGEQILPQVLKIQPNKIVCIYGSEEENVLCNELVKDKNFISKSVVKALPGDHHYNGDYKKISEIVLENIDK